MKDAIIADLRAGAEPPHPIEPIPPHDSIAMLGRVEQIADPFDGLADDQIVRATRYVEFTGTVAWMRKQLGQSLAPGRRDAGRGNRIDIIQGGVDLLPVEDPHPEGGMT